MRKHLTDVMKMEANDTLVSWNWDWNWEWDDEDVVRVDVCKNRME